MVYYLSFLRSCTSLYTSLKKHGVLDTLSMFWSVRRQKTAAHLTHYLNSMHFFFGLYTIESLPLHNCSAYCPKTSYRQLSIASVG